MVKMLNDTESNRIKDAVRAAEQGTSSEIVVHIARASGEDRGIAAVIGVLAMIVVFAAFEFLAPDAIDLLRLGGALAAGVLAFLVADHLDLGLKLLPARLVARDARRAARAVFLDRRLDATLQRNAVLLFISRAERYVEILPDRGLAAAVPEQRWTNIVTSFREVARQKGMAEAAADAVGRVGAVCAGPFPADAVNPDIISDKPLIA